MTNESELHTRIRQLEDEVARLRAVNEGARVETARMFFAASLRGGLIPDPKVVEESGITQAESQADIAVKQTIVLEQALADQAERERLGLGKQAELENGK